MHKFSTFQSEYKQLLVQLSLQTWTCEVSNILWENYHYLFKSINRAKNIFKEFLWWKMIIKYKRYWRAYGRGLPKVSDIWIKIKCQIQIYTNS